MFCFLWTGTRRIIQAPEWAVSHLECHSEWLTEWASFGKSQQFEQKVRFEETSISGTPSIASHLAYKKQEPRTMPYSSQADQWRQRKRERNNWYKLLFCRLLMARITDTRYCGRHSFEWTQHEREHETFSSSFISSHYGRRQQEPEVRVLNFRI